MRRPIVFYYATALVLALLAGYCLCRALLPYRPQPRPWQMSGQWMTAPEAEGNVGYFRKTFLLSSGVGHAWMAVAACDTFELTINGEVVGSEVLWKPNRAFQFTASERGQRVNHSRAIPWVSYAREYQWETFANYRLPVFFDISRFLRPGENVVCIRVDSRRAPVRLCVDGAIHLDAGLELPLRSDAEWTSSNLPLAAGESASAISAPGTTYQTFDPAIFARPFEGRWLRANRDPEHHAVWFQTLWHLDRAPGDAWVRLMTNRAYDLYINGRKVEPPTLGRSELVASEWIANTASARGRFGSPETLDPDDAGSLFTERDDAGDNETVAPTPLSRDDQVGTFDACSVGPLLHAGDNTISVRMVSPDSSLKWSPQLALDACVTGRDWSASLVSNSRDWTARIEGDASHAVGETGKAIQMGTNHPRLRYLGYCYSTAIKLRHWALAIGATVAVMLGLAFLLLRRASESFRSKATAAMVMSATFLAGAIVLDGSFAVRDEILWMLMGNTWAWVLLASGLMGGITISLLHVRLPAWSVRERGFGFALLCILLLCAATRLYKIDYQPTDADEWASLQTILSIADTGTPKLTDDVFYTRSPFFHYLVGGVVKVFGKNFWAMRAPSALFAVATCLLTYLCGARLLRSRWIGLGAAALLAIHPLAIDMSHQVRFYQQQQFFALLTVYFFCLGFVEEQQMRHRYLALAAFFSAVFSQEISVMIGFTLIPSYLLFAKGKDWRAETKWLVVAGCGLVFVVLDFVIFQTVCLTRVEGVSPSIEPALKLNLMYPSKLYWIFSLYSRLHFALSAVFFAGLPFALRRCPRNVLVLYLTFFGGIVASTVLITGSGVRFQYWLFPIFFLLTIYGARELAAFVTPRESGPALRFAMAALLVLTIGLSWSPWKIPGSYATKILPDADGAFAFVRQHLDSHDALAVTAPHTAAALMEVGRVDYDIEIPMLNDFVYRKDGRLIDRNGGAEVIARVDDLQDACARHPRLWVVLNRDLRLRSPGQNIAWQEPGGRFDLFVRTNLELKYQTYLADVFLWDSSKGQFRGFRRSL